jgi:hypothetical protein
MSEEEAVIVYRNVFTPQPSNGLADIFDRFADRGDHYIIWLRVSKLSRHVGTEM